MAAISRTQVHVKKTGSPTTVPDNPKAKLMYYLNCICSCVEADEDSTIRRLKDYQNNYSNLTDEEEAKLLLLCLALSPDKLIGSILFPADDVDLDGSNNKFLELSAVSTKLVVTESLMIGGQQKKVHKIMMFKKRWLEAYYLEPLRSFERAQRPRRPPQPRCRRC